MGTTVELVYQYRQLLGRCDTGTGLDFDEIDTLNNVESRLPSQPILNADSWRQTVDDGEITPAVIRGHRLNDDVALIHFGAHGCICRRGPYADEGSTVEVIIEDDDPVVSYRFKARVTWLDDDDDDFALGLEFIGVPVQVRYNTRDSDAALLPTATQVVAA